MVWLVFGLVLYFSYGSRHSKVQALNLLPSPMARQALWTDRFLPLHFAR